MPRRVPATDPSTAPAVPPSGDDSAGSLGLLVATLGHQVGRGFQRRLRPWGLEPRQYRLLRAVAAQGGRSQQAVASELGIPPSRMVALADALQERGLLERYPNPSDRRAHALRLTDGGQRLLAIVQPVAQAYEAELSGQFNEKERRYLLQLLGRMATHGRNPDFEG